MRRCLVALGLVLVVAGCGSGSAATKSTSAGSIPDGAATVPAKVQLFATVDSSFGDQWDAFVKLVDRFPIRGEAIDSIEQSLSQDGVDFDKDIKATVGPEVDIAAWNLGKPETHVIGMTQPKDKAGFEAALKKGSSPLVTLDDGDWLLFADTKADLDAYKALGGGSLADDGAFKDAFGAISDGALGRIYVDATDLQGALQSALKSHGGTLGSLGTTTTSGDDKQKLEWVAAGLEALEKGFKLDAVAKTEGLAVTNFDASVFDQVPSGAFLAAAFDGSGAFSAQLKSLQRNPKLGSTLGQFQTATGVSLEDVAKLVSGHGVLFARAGTPIPEVTLIVDGGDPQQSVATLDTLVGHLQPVLHSTSQTITVGGAKVTQVSIQGFSLLYGVVDGKLVVTTGQAGILAAQGSGGKLADDPSFKAAASAAGVSTDETSGLFYVDIQNAVTTFAGIASLAGQKLPPEASANIQSLRGFLVAGHAEDDGLQRVTVFLGVEPGPAVPATHGTTNPLAPVETTATLTLTS